MEKICYVSDTIEGGGSAVDSYKKWEMYGVGLWIYYLCDYLRDFASYPLSTNPTKLSNTLKGDELCECDHFVGLSLKGLKKTMWAN